MLFRLECPLAQKVKQQWKASREHHQVGVQCINWLYVAIYGKPPNETVRPKVLTAGVESSHIVVSLSRRRQNLLSVLITLQNFRLRSRCALILILDKRRNRPPLVLQ